MPLAAREVELVIIARDRTSATLARIGGALTLLGAGMARVGIAGIRGLSNMAEEAIEFRRGIALAFTQVEIAGTTFNDVLELVRDTARRTAVPIEELSQATYDIFSSITLENMDQARLLLDQFAMSATTGQAPIQDIGRAVFAWLNAMDQPATYENVTRILDVQFELVRKGIGTYSEFAEVMGRAIPAFVGADQTAEHFSATMAFLTRNGLSTANATASAARAVELLFSPRAIKKMRNMGIRLTDVDGTFRDMEEVLGILVDRWGQMDAAQQKLAFQDLFGQGTIQARRFFDIVLTEGKFEDFLALLDDMENSAGSVNEAFGLMSREPAIALDILRNRVAVFRQEIGDRLIPIIANRLIPAAREFFNWWDQISDATKDQAVQWAVFATVFLTVAGGITAVLGSLTLLLALLKAFTGSLLLATILGGGWIVLTGILAGMATAGILGFANLNDAWEELKKAFFEPIIPRVEDPMAALDASFADLPTQGLQGLGLTMNFGDLPPPPTSLFEDFLTFIQHRYPVLIPVIETVQGVLEEHWPRVQEVIETVTNNVRGFIENDWPVIWDRIMRGWTAIKTWWENTFWPFFSGMMKDLEPIWVAIVGAFEGIWEALQPFFGEQMTTGIVTVQRLWDGFVAFWEVFGTRVVVVISGMITQFGIFVETFIGVATGFLQMAQGFITNDPTRFLEGVATAVGAVATGVGESAVNIAETLAGLMDPNLQTEMGGYFDGLRTAIEDPMGLLKTNFNAALTEMGDGLIGFANDIIQTMAMLTPLGMLASGIKALFQQRPGPRWTPPLPPTIPGNPTNRGTSGLEGDRGRVTNVNFYGGIHTTADPKEVSSQIAFRIRTASNFQ